MNGTTAKTIRSFASLTGRDRRKMKKEWRGMTVTRRTYLLRAMRSEIPVLRIEKTKIAPSQNPVSLLRFGE